MVPDHTAINESVVVAHTVGTLKILSCSRSTASKSQIPSSCLAL